MEDFSFIFLIDVLHNWARESWWIWSVPWVESWRIQTGEYHCYQYKLGGVLLLSRGAIPLHRVPIHGSDSSSDIQQRIYQKPRVYQWSHDLSWSCNRVIQGRWYQSGTWIYAATSRVHIQRVQSRADIRVLLRLRIWQKIQSISRCENMRYSGYAFVLFYSKDIREMREVPSLQQGELISIGVMNRYQESYWEMVIRYQESKVS